VLSPHAKCAGHGARLYIPERQQRVTSTHRVADSPRSRSFQANGSGGTVIRVRPVDSGATRSKSQGRARQWLKKEVFERPGSYARQILHASFPKMANGRKQTKAGSKRQAEADDAAQRFGEHCPKCGSDDVKMVEPFNPVHADGIYCSQCGRHSFPDES
jgi:hypothetical protein